MEEKLTDKYIAAGFKIFPVWGILYDDHSNAYCQCGARGCVSPGKHPRLEGWPGAATNDLSKINKWFKKYEGCNWGMLCGAPSGVVVIDLDPRHGGDESWYALTEKHDFPNLETPEVWTGGGGQHLYFRHPGETVKKGPFSDEFPGVDIQGDKSFVVIPPSLHLKGERYKWKIGLDTELAPLPAWIVKNEKEPKPRSAPPVDSEIAPGRRNSTLVSMAGSMRRRNFSEDAIFDALIKENAQKCKPPLDESEVRAIAKSVSRYEAVVTDPIRAFNKTDLGNAKRLINAHGDEIRFCFDMDKWLRWDGRRWKPDAIAELEILAQQTVLSMYDQVSGLDSEDARKSLVKWAMKSEGRGPVANMIHMARPHVPILKADLDQNPMLLNCRNGTLDLKTGELQPHNPEDMISKLIEADYNPEAKCPRWMAFLELIFPSADERKYLQTAVGYSLTGRTTEHCFFNLYGTGANGKTTFTESIRLLLGDYAQRTDIQSIMLHWKDRGSAPTPHVASLAGARFVIASEIPEGRKLNEPLIKDLTGGDSISARFLHANPFTFVPTHKLWMFGNYKPKITGTDLGIWRRVKLINFAVTIPNDVIRPMDEIIGEFADELSGILAWAVEGCLRWNVDRLPDSEAVTEATKDYRSEQDVLQQFIDERCQMHPEQSIICQELFRAMRTWAEDSNEKDLQRRSKKWMTYQMKMRGIEQDSGRRRYVGIRLSIPG